ncbi:MAG TPA: cyclic pyranopterin monophosphate synthase MoaC [Spirochaetes bacterium]|nr:cyclic pyranopterin monophosphate synthase MoaC [Spirochaetota bacterium]
MAEFSHYSPDGSSRMVDVSGKEVTFRTAKAAGFVEMGESTLELIEKRLLPKGDLFEVARVAGIMAAKKNPELIPMCHPLQLNFVDVAISLDRTRKGVLIEAEARLDGKTGVEMEALTAVSVAALTVFDMCKAVDPGMRITDIRVTEKKGGKTDISR